MHRNYCAAPRRNCSWTFTLISLQHDDWIKLLENPELSPRISAPFMIFKDRFETTLMLDEIDFRALRDNLAGAKIEGNFRLLSFDIELDFSVVGFWRKSHGFSLTQNFNCRIVCFFTR